MYYQLLYHSNSLSIYLFCTIYLHLSIIPIIYLSFPAFIYIATITQRKYILKMVSDKIITKSPTETSVLGFFNLRGFANYIRTPISHFLFQIDLSHIYFLKSKFRTIFPKIPSKDNSLSYFMSPQRQAETGQGLCAGEIIGKRDSKQGFKLMQGILANIGNIVTIVLRSHSIFILLEFKQRVPGKILFFGR